MTGFSCPKRIKQKEMNGFWLKQEFCSLLNHGITPGGIFKSLSRFIRGTCKTRAGEKCIGSKLWGPALAWGQGQLEGLWTCLLVFWSPDQTSPRRKWDDVKAGYFNRKAKMLWCTGIYVSSVQFYWSESSWFLQNQSVGSGGPATGSISVRASSQVVSHTKIRAIDLGKHCAHVFALTTWRQVFILCSAHD